jgi:hypothetical protein
MNERTQDRLFAACGVASVGLVLGGAGIAMAAGKTHSLTVSSSDSQIAHALAKPVGTLVWTGAYLEMLSFGAFLAFAVWACAKLGGGLLGAIGRTAGTAYATLGVASLGVMDTIAYRSGHGLGAPLARTLVTLNEALYVGTWFLSAFFLLAAGLLAVTSARRILGWSAIGIALAILVATAVSLEDLGQMSGMLWLAWVVGASIALPRGERVPAAAAIPA